MKKLIFATLALVSALTCQAGVITFEGLAGQNLPGSSSASNGRTQFNNTTFTIDGFNFTTTFQTVLYSEEYWDTNPSAPQYPHNGTDYSLTYLNSGHSLTFEREDGSLFDFYSADIGAHASPDSIFSVVGYFEDGQSIEQLVTLDSIANVDDNDGSDFEYFAFDGFTGIRSLVFTGVYHSYEIALDNIETSYDPGTSAVPEPSTYALAFLCLIGLVSYRRRLIMS